MNNFNRVSMITFSLALLSIGCIEAGVLLNKEKGAPKLPLGQLKEKIADKTSDVGILFFYDDNGNLVKPTLELPPLAEIEATTVDDKVEFTLYTKEKPEGEPLVLNDVEKLKATKFNKDHETVFVTHGWINSGKSRACTLPRDAYLKKGDYNVIVVDWSKISMRPYGWASAHVKKVGQHVAKMIDFLESQGMNVDKVRLIGHSLGAHVMGSAGYYAKNKVNYLVGLDPALPLFYNSAPGSRISTEDAKHVEIIHTNAGLLGILVPVGHVDFYPNGGQKQVGCLADPGGACSHSRSYELLAESITSDTGFYGAPCKNYLKIAFGTCSGEPKMMGSHRHALDFKGTFFLETKEAHPFAKGMIH